MTPLEIFVIGLAAIIVIGSALGWINDRAEAWAERRNRSRR